MPNDTNVSETAEAPAPASRQVRFADLLDLFTRPRKFYSGEADLGGKLLFAVAWLLGIAAQIDRIDTEIIRHEIDPTRPTWTVIEPLVTGPWLNLWFVMVMMGIISGSLIYLIGGWWYRVRLLWSGAGKDTPKDTPRQVYCWAGLVVALPSVLIVVAYTIGFPNYLEAYNSEEMFSSLMVLMIFWSIGVSYIGATEVFTLTPWKARLWFLALPIIFYVFALGLIIYLMALLS